MFYRTKKHLVLSHLNPTGVSGHMITLPGPVNLQLSWSQFHPRPKNRKKVKLFPYCGSLFRETVWKYKFRKLNMIQRIINDLLSFVLKKLKEPTSSSNSYFERSTSLSSSSSSSSSTGGSTFLDLRSSLLNRCLSSLFYKQTQNGMTNITSRLVLNNFDYKNIIMTFHGIPSKILVAPSVTASKTRKTFHCNASDILCVNRALL